MISEGRMNKQMNTRSVPRQAETKGVYRQVIEDIQENAIKFLVEQHQPEWWLKLSKQKKKALKEMNQQKEQLEQILHMLNSGAFEAKPWEL